MTSTRRQFARTLTAAAGALGVFGAARASAQDDATPPNVFISPCGRPFRAPMAAPYPVVNWFKGADTNSDGKLDHAEFMADTEAFFKILDINGDGVLDGYEISIYEHRVAPEILGYRIDVGALPPPWIPGRPRLFRAQVSGSDMPGNPGASEDHEPSDKPQKQTLDESGSGAAPYGLFSAPEPVTAADTDFRGLVKKDNFMKLADHHFTLLDADGSGYLTLAKLPKTLIQQKLEKTGHRRS
jgi:EF hand